MKSEKAKLKKIRNLSPWYRAVGTGRDLSLDSGYTALTVAAALGCAALFPSTVSAQDNSRGKPKVEVKLLETDLVPGERVKGVVGGSPEAVGDPAGAVMSSRFEAAPVGGATPSAGAGPRARLEDSGAFNIKSDFDLGETATPASVGPGSPGAAVPATSAAAAGPSGTSSALNIIPPDPYNGAKVSGRLIAQTSAGLRRMIEENRRIQTINQELDEQLRLVRGQRTIEVNRINQLSLERDAYRKQLEDAVERGRILQADLDKAASVWEEKATGFEDIVAALQRDIDEKDKISDALQAKLKALPLNADGAPDASAVAEKIVKLEQERNDYRQQLDEVSNRRQTLVQELDKAQQEWQNKAAEFDRTVADLQQKLDAEQQKSTELRTQLAAVTADAESGSEAARAAADQVTQLARERDAYRQQLEAVVDRGRSLEEQLDQAQSRWDAKRAGFEDTVADLQDRLEEEQRRSDQIRADLTAESVGASPIAGWENHGEAGPVGAGLRARPEYEGEYSGTTPLAAGAGPVDRDGAGTGRDLSLQQSATGPADAEPLPGQGTDWTRTILSKAAGPQEVMQMVEELTADVDDVEQKRGRVYYNMGNTYFKRGEYDRAYSQYRRAVSLIPADASAHFNLAFVAGEYMHDYETAFAHYRRYLFLNPTASDARLVEEKIIEASLFIRSQIDSALEDKVKAEKRKWHN